jgi:hypothetical protein
MKTIWLLLGVALMNSAVTNALAAEEHGNMQHMMHHNMQDAVDTRTPLNLSPEMKQHQLSNMRSHVEAVQSIVGLVANGDFDQASQIAHAKLGLTDEMKKMCGSFGNEDFNKLGLAFHKSGDELGEVLKTKYTKKSLQALNHTMGYCVQCHATYRQ